MDIEALQIKLKKFASDRDWEQFHTPKNLVMALTGEAGELSEIFQWLTDEQASTLDSKSLASTSEELADILIYLIRIADVLGINLSDAVDKKLTINSEKYPVVLSKGNATKYNQRDL